MFDVYGYFHITYLLSEEDYTKMDYWDDKTFIYFLNCYSHWKDWRESKLRELEKNRPKI